MNQLSEDDLELIKRFEGFSSIPYNDAVGVRTIGYGHVIKPNESFTIIDEEEGESLLLEDAQLAGRWIASHVSVPLNDNQFSAVVSLVFNEGTAPLVGTLGARLNAGDYAGAAEQFEQWIYADHKVLPGLVTRRAAEKALFLTPVEQS